MLKADILMGPDEIKGILNELVRKLQERIRPLDDVAFIGIREGGEYVARALKGMLKEEKGFSLPLGLLDISFYRDDISKRSIYPEIKSTNIPFDVDDKQIVLVDDVLNTGRSVRAAIEQIVDLGRPQRIYLLVLFDRGGRELPIQPDFVGKDIELPPDKIVKIEGAGDGSVGKAIITGVKDDLGA